MVTIGPASRREGFSLLEVLMAVLLMAVIFVGLSAYNRQQRKALGRADRISEAARLAYTTLEKDKAKLANSAFFEATLDSLKKGKLDSTRFTNMGSRNYDVDLVRERVPSTFGLMRIKARASWDNRKRNITLSKLVTAP